MKQQPSSTYYEKFRLDRREVQSYKTKRTGRLRKCSGQRLLAVECRKVSDMAKATITIPLDPQTARAYDSAAPEQKRKMQALLSLWLRELAAGEYPSLQ